MPLLSWVRWHVPCKYLIAVVGDPGSPAGQEHKLQKSVLVPSPRKRWLWVTSPLWLNPDHKVEDQSCVLCWDFFPPPLPCGLFVWYCTGQRHRRLSYRVFSFLGQQSEMSLCALNCYTMVKYVIRCPEMFPLPPLPTCQNKYLIWKSRYRSQLDCTKGPVFLLLLLLFFNIIFLMGWVTVYSRIKGRGRDFGISLSSSMFLLWNLGFFCLLWVFCLSAHLGFPPPAFTNGGEEKLCACVCVWCPAKQRN